MKALMTLVLVLLLAGCAAGQGGAGGTSTEEETTARHAEETTVLGERFPQPPDGTLSYGGQEVKGLPGSFCWTDVCVDKAGGIVPPRNQTLTVPSGSEMVFRFRGQSPPETVSATASSPPDKVMATASPLAEKGRSTASAEPKRPRSLKTHGSGAERTIPVELPPGEYVVSVFVIAPQGDASYYFRVMVE
jgi:hypothetical protein